ncbi:uncharacterized protein LOC143236076 [Tachypleus tridentatus]|uniref:uncharacterized protein LOC143236076 n=1 Tax=Tachypleus tridentatus TaxID=6853 RepID=UPI003FD49BE0
MAILSNCCCWKSVRSGSFAAGFYTLGFYAVVIVWVAFHVDTTQTTVILVFIILMLIVSGLLVISSVLLLVGLCVDSRAMLIPWISCIPVTTLVELVLSLLLVQESDFGVVMMFLLMTDIFVCALNIYCLLCVVSQYQEYLAGRGRPGQHPVEYTVPRIEHQSSLSSPKKVLSPKPKRPIWNGSVPSSSYYLCPVSTKNQSSPTRSHVSSELSCVSYEMSFTSFPNRDVAEYAPATKTNIADDIVEKQENNE